MIMNFQWLNKSCYGVLLLELRCNNPDLAGDVGRIRDLAKVSFVIFELLKN